MTKKTSDSDTRDLYENLPKRFDHFIIDQADPTRVHDRGARVSVGLLSVIRPRGGSTRYYHTIQVKGPKEELSFRKAPRSVEIHPVLPADVPLALSQVIGSIGDKKLHSECRHAAPPGHVEESEVDPGWVELYANNTAFGAIHASAGWPTWKEQWYLPDTVYNLADFSGTVYDKPNGYQLPAGLTQWNHEVSALTGTYEGENTAGTWLLIKRDTVRVAVIHQIEINAGAEYVDTWWLSSNFVWWGNGDNPATVTIVSEANAKSYRAEFNTTTRYKHVVSTNLALTNPQDVPDDQPL